MALFQDPSPPHLPPPPPRLPYSFFVLAAFYLLTSRRRLIITWIHEMLPYLLLIAPQCSAVMSCRPDPPSSSPSISMCQSTCGLNLSGKPEPLQPSLKSPPLTAWWLLPPNARCRRGVREKRSELLRAWRGRLRSPLSLSPVMRLLTSADSCATLWTSLSENDKTVKCSSLMGCKWAEWRPVVIDPKNKKNYSYCSNVY